MFIAASVLSLTFCLGIMLILAHGVVEAIREREPAVLGACLVLASLAGLVILGMMISTWGR